MTTFFAGKEIFDMTGTNAARNNSHVKNQWNQRNQKFVY